MILMDEGKMQDHVASQMSSHPYRCDSRFLHWSKGCPKPFPRLRPRPTQRDKVLPGAPTWCFLQPPHRQQPDDFYPEYPRTKSKDCCSWGIWACFFLINAELPVGTQGACQEERETDSHYPCLRSPGPGKLKPARKQGPFKGGLKA